jgi:pentatricopeptide repeat protein
MKEDPYAGVDVITMNILLHFYSKSNNPEAAEALLNEMCSPESKVKPDAITFNTVISAWTACMRPESPLMLEYSDTVVPNVITFNCLLNSWVKSRPLEAHKECRRLVGTMFDLVEQGNLSVQPDVITYNTLINAHSVSGDDDAPLQAEMIFQEMDRQYEQGDRRLKPFSHTYGSLINAWSKSKNPQAGQKAEDILRLWMDRADAGAVSERPRVTNFSATVRAYTNSGDARAAHRADVILFLLLREYEKGNKFCKPDNWVLVSVLEALVASTVPNKSLAARRLVDMMKEHQISPDKHKVQLLKQCEI